MNIKKGKTNQSRSRRIMAVILAMAISVLPSLSLTRYIHAEEDVSNKTSDMITMEYSDNESTCFDNSDSSGTGIMTESRDGNEGENPSQPKDENSLQEADLLPEDTTNALRIPMYDQEEINRILDRLNLGIAKKSGRSKRAAVGETVWVQNLRAANALTQIIEYHEDGSYTEHGRWGEGVFGTSTGEITYCSDPFTDFKEGYKNVIDATTQYNQDTIDAVAGMLYYFDKYIDHDGFTDDYRYMFKQCAIWAVLCKANPIYAEKLGNARIETGNEVKDGYGNWYSSQFGNYFRDGFKWVEEHKGSVKGSGVLMIGGAGQDQSQWSYSVELSGGAKVKKVSSNTSITEPNGCYSLAGAEYTLYSEENLQNAVITLVTEENGESKEQVVPVGTYYAKETKASKGYSLDPSVYVVQVTENETATFSSTESPLHDPAGIVLQKIDRETGELPQGGASLAGAEFTIRYYDGYYTAEDLPEQATRTWVIRTNEERTPDGFNRYIARLDKNYFVGGDDFFMEEERAVIPLGTISIEETKAPVGYTLEGASFRSDTTEESRGGKYVTQVTHKDGIVNLSGGNEYTISDRVVRGDFELVKVDEKTQKRMANVPFKLTSVETGESHTFMTDENGYYSSCSSYVKHSVNTNGGDKGDGLWFGMAKEGEAVKVNDEVGALPYGIYHMEELPADANKDKILFSGMITIERDRYTVNFGTIENYNKLNPAISTSAREKSSNSHYAGADSRTVLIDTVRYRELACGETYRLKGVLMDKETHKPVLDAKGQEVRAEKEFISDITGNGEADMEFVFDASNMQGKTLVAFEELYKSDEKVAEHRDMTDVEQTIYFPSIHTTAINQKTGTHMAEAEKEIEFVDNVSYTTLIPGETHVLKGTVMDKETGEILDVEGTVENEVTFVPDKSSGLVEVAFKLDGSELEGKSLVVFEELFLIQDGKLVSVAEHKDLNNAEQTIEIPKVRTTATTYTGHYSMPSATVTIQDVVKYSHLIAGKQYTVNGILMDKGTGNPLQVDGKDITSEKTFVAEKTDGEVVLNFTFDASALAGKTIVVFEDLYHEGKKVGTHSDLTDEEQSIHIPRIETQAYDRGDNDKKVAVGRKVSITDKVSYENLIPGQEYRISGLLMDQATGNAMMIDGEKIVSETTFKAEKESGEAEVVFTLNTSTLGGKKLVVFEKLFTTDGIEIANHEDIHDEGQTVEVIRTPKTVKTGDDSLLYMVEAAGAMAMCAFVFVCMRRIHTR